MLVFYTISSVCVFTVYVFSLALITCDRLLITLLPLRYCLNYYTVGKAKISILVAWCTIWLIFICLLIKFLLMPCDIQHFVTLMDLNNIHVPEFELVLSGVYFIFAISTYTFIFAKYSRSRNLVTVHNNPSARPSLFRNFKNFKFSVAIILVGSFFFFRSLPHLIYYLFIQGISNEDSIFLENALYATRFVPDMIDALVYVFLYPPVRRFIREKMQKLGKRRRRNQVSSMDGVRSVSHIPRTVIEQ